MDSSVSRLGPVVRRWAGKQKYLSSIPLRFVSLFNSCGCGHNFENIEVALIAAHLNAGVIVMDKDISPVYCFDADRCKLQALVYDILPSTTAVFSYAIGSRKLSVNEQFFVGAPTVVSLLRTTQIKQGMSFIAANKVYTSTNKTTIV